MDMTTQGCTLGRLISVYSRSDVSIGAFGLNLDNSTATLPTIVTGKLYYKPASSGGYGYNTNTIKDPGTVATPFVAYTLTSESPGADGIYYQGTRGGTHINNLGMVIGWAGQTGVINGRNWMSHYPTLGNLVLMVPKKQ